MSHRTIRYALAPALALSAVLAVPATAAAPPVAAEQRVDVALEWYDVTAATIAAAGAPTQVTNNRTWAIGWLAATRALRRTPLADATDYQDAALAGAVHKALVTLVPARTEELDKALSSTLARIPDGSAETSGLAEGRRQAEAVLASREGDGLDPASVNAPFTPPPAAPGIWQPTAPSFSPAAQYGNRLAKPFLLRSADQFRPGPPPALGSDRYRRDLAEVRAFGSATSSVRTQTQTDTATFWLGSSYALYTEPLRVALAEAGRSPVERAKLVALFHVALVDTQIATSDTKYAYLRWRPITAIRSADDGVPSTAPDPSWTPLHNTPAHPDYPSGHNTYSGAAEQVLTTLVGARTARPFTIGSPSAPGVTRTFTSWRQLTQEDVDARVWSGIHTRTADTVGVTLGRQVAANDLREADRLLG